MSSGPTSFREFTTGAEGQTVATVLKTFPFDTETPVGVYLRLREGVSYSFLFESVEGGRSLGRYSIVGIDPVALVSVSNGRVHGEVLRPEANILRDLFAMDLSPMTVLRKLVNAVSVRESPGTPRFTGGWVGYFGYDSVRFVEDIPLHADTTGQVPDLLLALFTDVVVIDNVSRTVTLISNALVGTDPDPGVLRTHYDECCARLGWIEEKLGEPLQDKAPGGAGGHQIDGGTDTATYQQWVGKAKEYISSGDIFQVVLSRLEVIRLETDPLSVYRALRRINPSPYMYYLSYGDLSVIGSSPEMLVRAGRGVVETRPIAGTRPRGDDEAHDHAVEEELRQDTKERAEHLMLVDLARNDLGKLCVPGSVQVSEYMSVEKYSHVMHLCSTVVGTLREGTSPVDALYSCFPAGTLTGAPKIRAMEIINELEPVRRGVYGGAVGYIGFSGNLDTCIAIRTIVSRDHEFRLQAGAGIVHDSVPEREYRETVDKLTALVEAMKASGYKGPGS